MRSRKSSAHGCEVERKEAQYFAIPVRYSILVKLHQPKQHNMTCLCRLLGARLDHECAGLAGHCLPDLCLRYYSRSGRRANTVGTSARQLPCDGLGYIYLVACSSGPWNIFLHHACIHTPYIRHTYAIHIPSSREHLQLKGGC